MPQDGPKPPPCYGADVGTARRGFGAAVGEELAAIGDLYQARFLQGECRMKKNPVNAGSRVHGKM